MGGIFITGHDPDYHASSPAPPENPVGSQHIIQRAIGYVTGGIPSPRLLLVTDLREPGGDAHDSRFAMAAAGFPTYDVADHGSGTAGVLDLHTVDFAKYDCVVVASDNGGWLRQDELDILNARSADILAFVQAGGGLVAFSEAGNRAAPPAIYAGTTRDRFGFLPFVVAELSKNQPQPGCTVTPAGAAIGLVDADVNGNGSHSVFTATGGMDPVDLDADGQIVSLAIRLPDGRQGDVLWIDHLALLPGDVSVTTSFDAVTSGVGGGLTGLVVQSSTTGDVGCSGGPKVVHTAVEVPLGYTVVGVRVCYVLSNARSYIDQIRLAQVQNPPSTAVVLLNDATARVNPGPICIDSATTSIDPTAGPLLLDLRVNFGDTSDRIVVRGLGLRLVRKP